jgi:hypothetical protein
MRKLFICFFFIAFSFTEIYSQKIMTKNGTVVFEASVPTFEAVKAENKAVTCILNTQTGEIASLIFVKGFRFKIALMEEHFNENYVESDKYPKAILKGKIENFDSKKLTDKSQNYKIVGTIELHGKTKEITIDAKIRKTNEIVELISNFILIPEDFEIKIPSLVRSKVAQKVNVSAVFLLK